MKNKNKNTYLETMRHSAAHLLAYAVKRLYPKTKLATGPATSDGFYYDFEFTKPLKREELEKIEREMKRLKKDAFPFERSWLSIDKAKTLFKNEPYKLAIISEISQGKRSDLGRKNEISIYKSGEFIDLCKGPHVKNSSQLGEFKLLSIAGAYWQGNEKNKMLTRIYGTAFLTKKELDDYLWQRKEAKKRDHRLLGKKLDLFMFDNEVGPGLPLWLPKGAFIRNQIMEFAFHTYLKNGYQPVTTPHIATNALWQHSGHLDFYSESMYHDFGIENDRYRLKPMNCPLHVKMYNRRPRSYRELPIRWTEMGTVYRYEKSGELHGLTRVRGFTQDDAHIICQPNQLHQELVNALKLTKYILGVFGFHDLEIDLSVRDSKDKKKFIGSEKGWQQAEQALKEAIMAVGYQDYSLDIGGAVFYGPKIDVKLADSLGRKWQLSTIQVDFNLPGRFKMIYIDKNGQEKVPFMIHRALLGSLERFMGILIEHFGGAFPVWLAPVQVVVIPVSDQADKYGQEISQKLKSKGIRTEIDLSSMRMQKKILFAQEQKIPYMIIVGGKEIAEKRISVRTRENKQFNLIGLNKFISLVLKLNNNKSVNLWYNK